jgi:hypothetical protein
MCMCKKCMALGGIVWLIVGVLFLLQDLGVWSRWNISWSISWYTVVFVLGGITLLGMKGCPECCPAELPKGKKK